MPKLIKIIVVGFLVGVVTGSLLLFSKCPKDVIGLVAAGAAGGVCAVVFKSSKEDE